MQWTSDVLIVGTGLAGLLAALKVVEAHKTAKVRVLSKKELTEASTYYAQGGIASVISRKDSFEAHVQDTLTAGVGLCRPEVVESCVKEGPARIRDLVELGVEFSLDHSSDTGYDLGREGGHSERRVLHAQDMTGKVVENTLLTACMNHPRIHLQENMVAFDLILASRQGYDKERCLGVFALDSATGEIHSLAARLTLLASGGAGKVYLYTSNPDVCTGDGIAMAYRAGCRIVNMEFMQFHPTCLYHPEAKSFLISEALRGEGGVLRLSDGTAFMETVHPMASLAPRDVVARAIDTEMKRTGDDCVFLDMTHLEAEFLKRRFPTIYKRCLEYQIDLTTQPIPVVPAAHYTCGGIWVDEHGLTDVSGLLAAGEVTHTGLHGANRLASNSLLEAAVYAHRTASWMVEHLDNIAPIPSITPWSAGDATDSEEMVVVAHNWDEVRRLMWNYVGIVRSDKRLQRAARRLRILQDEIHEYYWNFVLTSDLVELRNLVTVASLIVESALHRQESRGLHTTVDYPKRDDEGWSCETVMRKRSGQKPARLLHVSYEQRSTIIGYPLSEARPSFA
jgi:L-aspartate oxidase